MKMVKSLVAAIVAVTLANVSQAQTYNIPAASTTSTAYLGTATGDLVLKSSASLANVIMNAPTGNIFINTAGTTTVPNIAINSAGKVGIGRVPAADASAGGPFSFIAPALQIYGLANNAVPAYSPSEIVSIKNSDNQRLGFGANYIQSYYSTAGANDASYIRKPLSLVGNPVLINKLVVGESILNSTPAILTTTPGNYDIYAKNGILTGKIKVAVMGTANWADYVFQKDYKLISLGEVETYIHKNKHLPGVPSAEEVVKEGINLGEMDAKLLQKIEELTLYMIEMKKENSEMKKEIEQLKNIQK